MRVVTVAERTEPVRGVKGLRVLPDHVFSDAPVLHEAGFARGKRVTTHWAFVKALQERGDVIVLDGPRYVRDGNLVTAAGVSAGIDMALWLVGQLESPAVARQVQRAIQYDPAPPYAAEV